MTTLAPLAERRQIPLSPSSSPMIKPSTKRALSSEATTLHAKRIKATTPVTPSDERVVFKIPSIPNHIRALTPSTSTVAASSSPPRDLPSSPTTTKSGPSKKSRILADVPEEHVVLSTRTLLFGRHRHRVHSPSPDSSDEVDLRVTIPNHLRHLVSLDRPAEIVYLSRHASHASRVHACVEYLEEEDVARILVIGQNGMKIGGKRVLAGQRVDVKRREKDLVLDFHGARVIVAFPPRAAEVVEPMEEEEVAESRRERLFTPTSSSPAREALSPVSSLPPSSPPIALAELEEEAVESHRGSSPLSSPGDDRMEIDDVEEEEAVESVETTAEKMAKEVKAEIIDQAAPKSRKSSPAITQEERPRVPAEIDLPALLASTVVFSGSSKLSLPDMVKHMLESQPSLRAHGDESVWKFWCNDALENNGMFGKVQRHGKDSSGRPLQPHYFYNPDNDPDQSRAKELGGLVRPLRTVQRGGGKAIDWRPVGSGRRKYW